MRSYQMMCGSSIFTSWFRLVCGSQRSQLEFVLWWCGPCDVTTRRKLSPIVYAVVVLRPRRHDLAQNGRELPQCQIKHFWHHVSELVQFLYRGCVFFFFFFFPPLTRRYSCIGCWKCVNSASTLNQCSCHWFSDNTFGVKLDLVCHVIYPTHC